MTSIKYLPSGCMATPVAGKKCPTSIPDMIANNTQKVRFVAIFFYHAFLVNKDWS